MTPWASVPLRRRLGVSNDSMVTRHIGYGVFWSDVARIGRLED
jgi:hypothetical protein